MPNYDYFKQYTSEQNRIREKIQAEENPYHREHIVFFNEMVEDKIKSMVPPMIQQYNEAQRVNVETYLNGKPLGSGDLVKGVRNMVAEALKKMGAKMK